MDDVKIISPRVRFAMQNRDGNIVLSREGFTFLRDALNGLSNRIDQLEYQIAQTPDATALLAETVKYGTYVPTLTNTTNVTASTAYTCQYVVLGRTCIFSGRVDITPTAAAGTATALGMSLPIPSVFSALEMLGGTAAVGGINQSAQIRGDTANNRATVAFASQTTSNTAFIFSAFYRIR